MIRCPPKRGNSRREGEFECGDLVAEVLRARFGVTIDLPRPGAHRERDAQWRRLSVRLADPVPEAAAREGDVAHMCRTGHPTAHHLGVLVVPSPADRRILHCARGLGTCLHAVETLPQLGYTVHGYYRPAPARAALT